jgi:hypothetical protein
MLEQRPFFMVLASSEHDLTCSPKLLAQYPIMSKSQLLNWLFMRATDSNPDESFLKTAS